MRCFIPGLLVAAAGLLALPALAQPPDDGKAPGDRPRREEMRERMIKEFDADGDGKLNDDERQKARETMQERFGRRGPDGGPRPKDGKGKRDGRGPHGPGPGPDGAGPPRPPHFEMLFNRFDEDKSDSLSRDEFRKLAEFVRDHRPGGPGGPPPRPGDEGFRRRPGGPPPFDRPGRPDRRDRDAKHDHHKGHDHDGEKEGDHPEGDHPEANSEEPI